ncbi:Replication protein A subunit [Chionoecetes opilio]|uniref:Replication protein A subunit n=1 Tax=Chionoecetes opilio TaxID=41210 RepID=A0A8J4XNP8_CHIOP|nr:Replication protein A subunit [Chionoecetes opilio]
MWSDQAAGGGGGSGGGGFNTSFGGDDGAGYGTQQFASPGPEVKKNRRIESVLPLTINTVLELDENNQDYLGTQVNMMTVMGLICEVDVTSTKVTYTLDDTTGAIKVIKWLDSETEEEPLMENTYCRVHGTFKTYQGAKQVLALHLEPVTNLNWVTAHILEVVHAALQLQRLNTQGSGGGVGRGTFAGDSGGAGNSGMSNSMVGLGGMGNPSGDMGGGGGGAFAGMGLTAAQKSVFEVIRTVSDDCEDSGHSREHIRAKVKGKVAPQQVDDALFFLSSEGHIYTTVDEDHFRSTDG